MTNIIKFLYNKVVFLMAKCRAIFWSLFVKKMGENVKIKSGVIFYSPGLIEIGDNVMINYRSSITGADKVKIGNDVLIGPQCHIITVNHNFQDINMPIRKQGYIKGPVVIEDDVWLGINVIVLPNVKIGKGSIIGANSVVTKDIPEYSIAAGIPAKVIKNRKDSENLASTDT